MSVQIQKQDGGTCYAHASTRIMFEAWCRVDGATVPAYDTMVALIIKKYGTEGGPTFDAVEYFGDPKARKETGDGPAWNLAEDYFDLPKLRMEKKVPQETFANYLATNTSPGMEFKDVIVTFGMSALRWGKFDRFFKKNPEGIITASHLALTEGERDDAEYGQHAVVVDAKRTSIGHICLKNSYGSDWGNGGSFFVDKLETLEPTPSSAALQLATVSWSEDDIGPSLHKPYRHCQTAKIAIPQLGEEVTVDRNRVVAQGNTEVCIGKLPDGEKVAVKRVAAASRDRLYYIQHSNIVEVYGYQEAPHTQELEADSPRCPPMVDIVMELADGTLKDRIEKGGRLGQQEALAVMRDVTSAVVKLADEGIAHCDIKPQNILLFINKKDATVASKIADFGLARRTNHDGTFSGTRGWSDPLLQEGCEEEVVPLHDCFSLGRLAEYLAITLPPTIVTEGPIDRRSSATEILHGVKQQQFLDHEYEWFTTAFLLGPNDTITIRGTEYTKQDCYRKALESDASNSLAWYNLGCSIAPNTKIRVDGTEYTKQECYCKALDCDASNIAAWSNLGTSIAPNTTVRVHGTEYTQQDCYRKAVDLDASYGAAWCNLGDSTNTTVRVHGIEYTKQHCFFKALACDANALAWSNLGTSIAPNTTVSVNGTEYTDQDCYLKALDCDANHSRAWNNLGSSMTPKTKIRVDGTEYTKQECYRKALDCDASKRAVWSNLGDSMTPKTKVRVDDKEYTKQDCYIKAVELEAHRSRSWSDLGNSMSPKTKVPVDGKEYTEQDCYYKALELDANNGTAWCNLGAVVAPKTKVPVDGTEYTQQDCYRKAVELDAGRSYSWFNLGTSIAPNTTVSVNGTQYTGKDCYCKAVECDALHSNAWSNLGAMVAPNTTVRVHGAEYTKQDCYRKAVESDASNSNAWYNLGTSIAPNTTVFVDDTEYTKQDCFEKYSNCEGFESDPQLLRDAQRHREEGQKLFRKEHFQEAQTRFEQALVFLGQLHDTTPEETKQMRNEISLSCHLNIASCSVKLSRWKNASSNATKALNISPSNAKAFFRRGQAKYRLHDYPEALKDLEKAKELTGGDAGVVAELEVVKLAMEKEKAKEKKLFSKMFG